ncbi:MAG: polysaccharide biosynthesis protein [Clostridia bacterium]|nr:polysaccharide biosynthesis protein [Clostridia bacterium]
MDDKRRRKAGKLKIEHWHLVAICLMICDFLAILFSYFLALWVRFDCNTDRMVSTLYWDPFKRFIIPYAVGAIVLFWFFRMYRSVWRYASYSELIRTFLGSVTASVLHIVLISLISGRMPISYYFGGLVFQLIFLIIIRFSYRLLLFIRSIFKPVDGTGKKVMIVGAGQSGQMILRDMRNAPALHDKAVCFIDDDPTKWGKYIEGVPIVGGRDDIMSAVKEYEVGKIYFAIPTAKAEDKKDILNICNETGCEIKILPALYQLVLGQVTVSAMKDVSVEDLLGREPIQADMTEVFNAINGKVVMVTGGGGSIGSELCRQVAAHEPKQLIIFDIYENNAYAIQLELRHKYPKLDLVVLIGSVRDSRRMFEVFGEYRPQIVYHAAAHKHVPLMEDSPNEAIKNNAIGTYKTAYAAMAHGCERFVLISTDKAVNPTNIMGASKRLCEMIIQSFDAKIKAGKAHEIPQLFTHDGTENADKDGSGEVFRHAKTDFVAVRFGNVLGSNGSVIPIFKKQIEEGGPVTVTHPDIIRYFMTIPEAVSLVMLAGTYAHGGEIFVLDMGSPVKIDTLARNLIKLSGFKPDEDIKIVYSGLRPGEKLFEEKLMAEEGLRKTDNDLIHIGCPIPFDTDEFLSQLDGLMTAAYGNKKDIRERVAAMVSTYQPENKPAAAAQG